MNVSCHNANAPICFIKQCHASSKDIELCEHYFENEVSYNYKNVIPKSANVYLS